MDVDKTHGLRQRGFLDLVSRLLGLGSSGIRSPRSQSIEAPLWTNADIKLSDMLQGITLSLNFWWLLLFLAFILWLCVVYWIRHHEPLVNNALGNIVGRSVAVPFASTYDRQIVNTVKDALPFTPDMRKLPAELIGPSSWPGEAHARSQQSTPLHEPLSAMNQLNASVPSVMPTTNSGPSNFCNSDSFSYAGRTFGAYHVAVPYAAGTRLKIIVNR